MKEMDMAGRQISAGGVRRIWSKYRSGFLLCVPVAVAAVAAGICAAGCSLCPGADGVVTILTYNVQNLFDDVANGTEYPEYDPGEGEWDSSLYHAKMYNIAEAVRRSCSACPDVVMLQEVENQRVLEDLDEMYLKSCGYQYRLACASPESAVTVGLLSRIPVTGFAAHQTDLPGAAPVRDIMEARLELGANTLYLFNNHWKSKSGGAEATEGRRILAAAVLAARVADIMGANPDADIVVAGDLNEDIREFDKVGGAYRTALMPCDSVGSSPGKADETNRVEALPWPPGFSGIPGGFLFVTGDPGRAGVTIRDGGAETVLCSPWLCTELRTGDDCPGSYSYKSEWERIDHFLLSPGIFDESGFGVEGFDVMDLEFLLDREGYPRMWRNYTGSGYSDHLPLLLTLKVR